MRSDAVSVEKREGWAIITMEHLSLNRHLGFGVSHSINTLTHDEDVRVIVLTGRKNVFLSGVDLREITRLNSAAAANKILEVPRLMIQSIASCPKPTIAAINGFCLGAGAELALTCDLRVAVEEVRNGSGEGVPFIGFLHVQRGMTPHLGGTQILPRLVGAGRAKDLLMTARAVTAAEALRIGLVDRVVPAALLREEVLALAASIARNDAVALRMAKELVHRSFGVASMEDGLRAEREAFARCRHEGRGEQRPRLPDRRSSARGT